MNRGNYRELLESYAKLDSVFERRLHRSLAEPGLGGDSRYTGVSPEIQNDLICCLDSIIEDIIVKSVHSSVCRLMKLLMSPLRNRKV